jgi:hypothetical protein
MTPTGLIDEAVHLFKARPRTMIAIAYCFTVPVGIVVGFLQRGCSRPVDGDVLNDPSTADAAARSDNGKGGAHGAAPHRSPFTRRMPTSSSDAAQGDRGGEALRRSVGDMGAPRPGRSSTAELAGAFVALGWIVVMAFCLATAPATFREARAVEG